MQNNDIVKELSQNFIEYAYAVNSDRAIPNAVDGLKPVAKRILWSAYCDKYTSNKPHVKAAKIVGSVMGNYHPHGDSSIYGALVRLSQSWVMRYPLIDWHGSNGNITGDGAASMRYTEARLAKLAEDGMLYGIKKRNVCFMNNYDETLEEPVSLPAIFPNLLCNPNTGIGVAMACNWAPHNLREVANAIHEYTEGKEPSIPGPDFPTGGLIINGNELPAIVKSGRGTVKIRSKYKVEKNKIIFYEIPYGTTIEGLLEQIGKVCDAKEVEGVVDAHDESNKKGIRIVVECERNLNADAIAMKLFATTDLQTTFSYNQVALVDKTPTELSLKDCIKIYVDYNIDCLTKECNFDLSEINKRIEVIEGLLKALEDIDNIIALIKKSDSSADAKVKLIEKYNFTESQAKAIVGMRLGSLANLEKVELNNEYKGLLDRRAEIEKILSSRENLIAEILVRLDELVKKYGDDRKTEIVNIEVPKEDKEEKGVIPEDVVVVLSADGDVKRVPRAAFKTQRRNGKGVKVKNKIMATVSTNTLDTLLIFSSAGKMYRILVDKIPVGTNTTSGVNIATLVKMESLEKVIAITSISKNEDGKYLVFFTKKGMVKKTLLSEYLSVKKNSGIYAIKLKEGDSLANVEFMNEEPVLVLTRKGMSIKFETASISATSRLTSGVKSIKLDDTDEVLTGLKLNPNDEYLAAITSIGRGKILSLKDFTPQARGGKGSMFYRVDNDRVVSAAVVELKDEILITGSSASICVKAEEFPISSKIAMGNQMIKDNNVIELKVLK